MIVTIPKVLRERLTDEGTDALISVLNQVEEKTEDKFERRITEEISKAKVEIIRWMVTLWITQMLAILALFFRK